jgi:hypothetical protein
MTLTAMDANTALEALALAEGCVSARDAAKVLRERYAPLRVVVVDAFDMRGETPAAQGATRTLYYGASDGHCWHVTSDAARAAGFFVTERD